MKTITTSILTALASVASMFGYYDNKLAGSELVLQDTKIILEETKTELEVVTLEKETAINAKQDILKDYIYSQIRLLEVPPIDLTFATPQEIQQAYINLAEEKQIVVKLDDDLFIRLRDKAVLEGSACKVDDNI